MANTVKKDINKEEQNFDLQEILELVQNMKDEIKTLKDDLDQAKAERDIAMSHKTPTLDDEIVINEIENLDDKKIK